MAKGKTHDTVNLFIILLFIPLLLSWFKDYHSILVFIGFYLLGTYYLSPDLDIGNSLPYRRWGNLRFIWYVYSKIIPHRSWISHSFLIGTVFRLLWLSSNIFLLGFIAVWLINLCSLGDFFNSYNETWFEIKAFCLNNIKVIIIAFLGLIFSSLAHQFVDAIWSFFFKRR